MGKIRSIIPVFPASDANLAKIIHACPYKIAHQTRLPLGLLPKTIRVVAEGFASQDQSVWIFLQITPVAVDTIVVTRDIHIGEGVPGFHIASMECRTHFHELITHQSRHIVEELASDRFLLFCPFSGSLGFLGLFRFPLCLFIAIHAKANRAEEVEEDIDTTGYRAARIQLMQVVRHFLCQGNSFFLRSFTDLVSGGIQDHTGMVKILFYHIL